MRQFGGRSNRHKSSEQYKIVISVLDKWTCAIFRELLRTVVKLGVVVVRLIVCSSVFINLFVY